MDSPLYVLMHNDELNGTVNKLDKKNLRFEKEIKQIVDLIISDENSKGNNQLLPLEARSTRLENEIRESIDLTEFGNNFSKAISLLVNESKNYLNKEEADNVLEEVSLLCHRLSLLDLDNLDESSFQLQLSLPSKSLSLIQRIGVEKFNHAQIEDCLSLFTFLTALNPKDPDYCYRLGIVAQKAQQYQLALRSFDAAANLAPDFIGPPFFAAECYFLLGQVDLAKERLELAKKLLNHIEGDQERKEWVEGINDFEISLS